MAFPTVQYSNTWQSPAKAATHVITLPTVVAGSRIITVVSAADNRTYSGVTAGWSLVYNDAILDVGTPRGRALGFTKISNGTETTVSVSFTASEAASAITFVVNASLYNVNRASPANSSTIDPPAAATTGGWTAGYETLFLTGASWRSNVSRSTSISGWTLQHDLAKGGDNQDAMTAWRLTSTSTQNPGTFNLTGTTEHHVWTWAVWNLPVKDNALFWAFP